MFVLTVSVSVLLFSFLSSQETGCKSGDLDSSCTPDSCNDINSIKRCCLTCKQKLAATKSMPSLNAGDMNSKGHERPTEVKLCKKKTENVMCRWQRNFPDSKICSNDILSPLCCEPCKATQSDTKEPTTDESPSKKSPTEKSPNKEPSTKESPPKLCLKANPDAVCLHINSTVLCASHYIRSVCCVSCTSTQNIQTTTTAAPRPKPKLTLKMGPIPMCRKANAKEMCYLLTEEYLCSVHYMKSVCCEQCNPQNPKLKLPKSTLTTHLTAVNANVQAIDPMCLKSTASSECFLVNKDFLCSNNYLRWKCCESCGSPEVGRKGIILKTTETPLLKNEFKLKPKSVQDDSALMNFMKSL